MFAVFSSLIGSVLGWFLKNAYGKIFLRILLFAIFYVAMKGVITWGLSFILAKFGDTASIGMYASYVLCQLHFGMLLNAVLSSYFSISMSKWAINRLINVL